MTGIRPGSKLNLDLVSQLPSVTTDGSALSVLDQTLAFDSGRPVVPQTTSSAKVCKQCGATSGKSKRNQGRGSSTSTGKVYELFCERWLKLQHIPYETQVILGDKLEGGTYRVDFKVFNGTFWIPTSLKVQTTNGTVIQKVTQEVHNLANLIDSQKHGPYAVLILDGNASDVQAMYEYITSERARRWNGEALRLVRVYRSFEQFIEAECNL